jgi:hypothetical protein
VCDDLQFARNAKCRRCATPKPTEAALKIAEARRQTRDVATDWTCTLCDDLQFARNAKCRRCGAAKPTPEAAREYKARKRAEARAAEEARVAREAQMQAEIKRKAEEMAAHERRLTAAMWAQARLLLIGARDEASPLSRLPPELVEAIGRWATGREACWASSRLAWFKSQARANPNDDGSGASVRVTTYDIDPYGDKPCPENMRGFMLVYHHSRRKPDQAADEPFTIDWWATHGSTHTSGFKEYWTEAKFLATASFDAEWKRWLSSSHTLGYCSPFIKLKD